MSPAKQEMDDCESLTEFKRQDTCIKIEEIDGGSLLNMQESSTKRPKEPLIKEQSSTHSFAALLHISPTSKPLKVVQKEDIVEQHLVYIHIHSKQGKAAFHLDHVMQDPGESASLVIVDEENFKPVGLYFLLDSKRRRRCHSQAGSSRTRSVQ